MRTSEENTKIWTAYISLIKDITPVKPDAKNDWYKSTYATYGHIRKEIDPILRKHEITLMQYVLSFHGADSGVLVCTTRLIHNASLEWMEINTPILISHDRLDPHGCGSAETYGKRRGLTTLLGLITEDDDGNAGSNTSSKYAPAGPSVSPRQENHSPGASHPEGDDVTIYVYFTGIPSKETREELKGRKFRFEPETKAWYKGVVGKSFIEQEKAFAEGLPGASVNMM